MNQHQQDAVKQALTNSAWNIDRGQFLAAEAWAADAANILREANLTADQQRMLVAPNGKATTGDKIAVGLSAAVLLWMLFSILSGVWYLP